MFTIKIKKVLPYKESFPVTAHPGYLASSGGEYGYLCGYIGEKLTCFIPFTVKKKFLFKYIEFKSETIIIDDSIDETLFLNSLVKVLKDDKKYDFIAQPTTNTLFNSYPEGSIVAPFGAYRIDLSQSIERLWENVHSKHKNVIRRALREGVKIETGDYLFDLAYANIEQTLQRSDMKMIPRKQLWNMLNSMPDAFLVACSFHKDVLQSSAIVLYSQKRGYYFWGGTASHALLGANNLLHWEIIKFLKLKRVREYDFVGARIHPAPGSKLAGIQRFKRRFGARMYYGYLWKYPLKRWKYILFSILLRIKQKGGDIIDQEKDRPLI